MIPTPHKVALLVATLILLGSTEAKTNESAESGGATPSGVVDKVEEAIVRGAKAAASGVDRGTKAAARGIEHGAKAARSGVEAAARGVERGAEATGNTAHAVAEEVGDSPTPTSSADK